MAHVRAPRRDDQRRISPTLTAGASCLGEAQRRAEDTALPHDLFRLLGFLRAVQVVARRSVLTPSTRRPRSVAAYLTGDALAHVIESEDRERPGQRQSGPRRRPRPRRRHGQEGDSRRQALGVEFDLRNQMYAKLLRLSFRFYDRHQNGQLMSRATVDLQRVRFFLGYGLIFFFQHVLTIVAVPR